MLNQSEGAADRFPIIKKSRIPKLVGDQYQSNNADKAYPNHPVDQYGDMRESTQNAVDFAALAFILFLVIPSKRVVHANVYVVRRQRRAFRRPVASLRRYFLI